MFGVKFNENHSYDYYNLVLNSFEIVTADIKTNLVDMTGADGFF